MRVCLVYDCLYPYTVGGAERWYRALAERLSEAGHAVTYLTLRQWEDGDDPRFAGVDVVAVGPQFELYTNGRRRIVPTLAFGAGVLGHLARRGRRYDVVHTASMPYFSLLAAAAARRRGGFQLVVDWHEVWTREYWREYLGAAGGLVGWLVQRACVRVRQRAFCFSRLHGRRLVEEGLDGQPTVLEGEYAGALESPPPERAEPLVVFAGRLIPEKRAPSIVPAVALARERIADLRCEIFGDGPDHDDVVRMIDRHGLTDVVDAPGFVGAERVNASFRRALCLLLPSRREGYGLVVVEAAAAGTPSVVVRAPDNAATELIEDGVNGIVAESHAPKELADAVVRIHELGHGLRESTAAWFRRNARRLSLASSLETVLRAYASR